MSFMLMLILAIAVFVLLNNDYPYMCRVYACVISRANCQ